MRHQVIVCGEPNITEGALTLLVGRFGATKGLEVYKKALLVRALGWHRLRKLVNRSTVLRIRRELLDGGVLEGAYEEEVGLDEMMAEMVG